MDNTVLITIRCNGRDEDFEISDSARLSKWMGAIADYLRNRDGRGASQSGGSLMLSFRGRRIDERDNLKQLGLEDGSIIDAVWR